MDMPLGPYDCSVCGQDHADDTVALHEILNECIGALELARCESEIDGSARLGDAIDAALAKAQRLVDRIHDYDAFRTEVAYLRAQLTTAEARCKELEGALKTALAWCPTCHGAGEHDVKHVGVVDCFVCARARSATTPKEG